jgi:hypothetical protein
MKTFQILGYDFVKFSILIALKPILSIEMIIFHTPRISEP